MLKILKNLSPKSSKPEAVVSSYRVATQLGTIGHELSDSDRLAFIHHRTSIFNLGDYLSSPRHYFKFTPMDSGRPVVIIGGGTYGSYNRLVKKIPSLDLDKLLTVGWGVGLSLKEESADGEKMTRLAESLDYTATRDCTFAAADIPFCPCSSVFNSINEIAPGSRTGILINFDPRASGSEPLKMLDAYDGFVIGTNAHSEREFRAVFSQTSHIVTNSYHTAYWGLMSGRSVGIVGFSSKYDNLLSMFELDTGYVRYNKGDRDALKSAIDAILQEGKFYKLDNPEMYKAKFRDINLDYTKRLVEAGVFKKVELIPDDESSLERRSREVFAEYVLAECPY